MKTEGLDDQKLSMESAMKIAENAIGEKEDWDSLSSEAKPMENGYRVTVWREPKTPGGFRLVSIDKNGKITAIEKGK